MSDNPPEEQEVNSNKVTVDLIFFLIVILLSIHFKICSENNINRVITGKLYL